VKQVAGALFLRAVVVLLVGSGLEPGSAHGQLRLPTDSLVRLDSTPRISPGKAFYRSLLIPGWGQASVGAYVRGGTFFALQSASAFMLVRTLSRLHDAQDMETRRVALAADSLLELSRQTPADSIRLSDPARFQAALDSAPGVRQIRNLIESRKEQRQDWITYMLVFTLASGVDAFVAAHLANFPGSIDATPRVGGGANLEVRLPLGRSRQ
jgi:hypothetical protein